MMKSVINYLLSNDLAEIPKRGRRELKSIIIDDKKNQIQRQTNIDCLNKETINSKEN